MAAILLFVAILALLLCHNLFHVIRETRRKMTAIQFPPEAAGRWPVIGHLPLLQGKEQLALTFATMADRYGPVFTIWSGAQRIVVVSSWELVEECFRTNDKIFATRPRTSAGKYLGYNYTMMGLAPHGPAWRFSRKLANTELLSAGRLKALSRVRDTEVDLLIKHLYGLWEKNKKLPVKVEIKELFFNLTFNTLLKVVVGRRNSGVEEVKRAEQVIGEFFRLTGAFVASDAVPFLEWLDLKGHISAMKRVFEELDSVASVWIDEHRARRNSSKPHQPDGNFIGAMLSIADRSNMGSDDEELESYIKAISLNLVLAGTISSFITLTWTLSLLLNNRHELKKAQDELDTIIGKDRSVKRSDMNQLPYIEAILKESLRLYPAGPLGAPHEAMKDCNIGGFHIPAATRLIVNLYKLHRDPRVWAEPEEFRPERFLTTHRHMDIKGTHFEFIPFGSGRRMCPGMTSAMHLLPFTLARLLHGFDVETPNGERVRMKGTAGEAMSMVGPLNVIATPRLASNLYM